MDLWNQTRSRQFGIVGPLVLLLLAGCAARNQTTASPAGMTAPVAAAPEAATERLVIIDGNFQPAPMISMGDPATVARIIDEGKNRNQVMDHLTYLCTDIGPRLTGSSSTEAANRWTREQFESWGLTNAHLWQWGEIPVRFDRGPSSGKVLLARTVGEGTDAKTTYSALRDLEFTTLSWGAGTNGPVRGKVVRMPTNEEEFEAVRDQIKGSWMLIKASGPGGRRGVGGFAGGMSARNSFFMELRSKWSGKGASSEEKPAAPQAIVIPADGVSGPWEGSAVGGRISSEGMPFVLDWQRAADGSITGTFGFPGYRSGSIKDAAFDGSTGELKFTWEGTGGPAPYVFVIKDGALSGTRTMSDGAVMSFRGKRPEVQPESPKSSEVAIEERVLREGPAGFLSSSSDDRVRTSSIREWRRLSMDNLPQDPEVQIRQSDYDFINSRLADGVSIAVEFELNHQFTKGPIPVYNTVAEIRGSHWPEQLVIVSAHIDSWDGPGSRGTTDNGTGTCVTLEAARILMAANAKPKRTIRFILWTGEEQGLLGSRAYVDQFKDILPNISAVFVDDGGTNYEGGLHGTADMVPMLAAATAPVTAAFPDMPVNVQTIRNLMRSAGGGSSDHASFVAAGVPGFFWDEVGRADYGYGWHTQYDRLDLAIPEYLVQSSTCAAVTAYNLACADDMLPREKREESRPANPRASLDR